MTDRSPFASPTVAEHLMRGTIGFGALAALLIALPLLPGVWAALAGIALAATALVAFRGCPACWTMGLIDTLSGRANSCATCPNGKGGE